MKYTKKHIEHMIDREKNRMRPLIENFEDLSKWGLWTIGYCKGRISLLEDLLYELEEIDDVVKKTSDISEEESAPFYGLGGSI